MLVVKTKVQAVRATKVQKIPKGKKIVSKTPVQSLLEVYSKSWRKFFDSCTIDGIRLVGGFSTKISTQCRIANLLYFLLVSVIMGYLCSINIKEYLSFSSQTSTTYMFQESLTFPTVSISNQNIFQRSYIGGNNYLMLVKTFTNLISQDDIYSQLDYFMKLNEQTCATNSTVGKEFNVTKVEWNRDSFNFLLTKIIMNSSLSVHRCWWNEIEIDNCTNEFSNWAVDDRYGISFNAQTDMYNLKEGFIPKTTVIPGPHGGLRLLMDVRQDEYCGVESQPYGAGFKLMFHNPFYRQPSTELYPSISVGPGYSYEISIQPVTYNIQRLEWLGYCLSDKNYKNSLTNDVTYNQQVCLGTCFADIVYDACKCIVPWIPLSDATANYYSTTMLKILPCIDTSFGNMEMLMCFIRQTSHYFHSNPKEICPYCKRPCFETVYSYQLTSSKLITKKVNELLKPKRNVTYEEVKKNILQLNVYFSDLTEVQVIESLRFTSLNLFIFLGNNVGLCIGISTLSLFEIVYQIVFSFHAYFFIKHN